MGEERRFLFSQLEWTRKQMDIYDQMDSLLHEMKGIAEEAAENSLLNDDRKRMQRLISEKQQELESLSQQLKQPYH